MWGQEETIHDLTYSIKLAQPADGCEPYTNTDSQKRFGYYIQKGGGCSLGTKIHNAQVAGAKILFIQFERDDYEELVVPDHINGTS